MGTVLGSQGTLRGPDFPLVTMQYSTSHTEYLTSIYRIIQYNASLMRLFEKKSNHNLQKLICFQNDLV